MSFLDPYVPYGFSKPPFLSTIMYWLLILPFVSSILAHSWNEQLTVIVDGKYAGQNGYPRGYISRSDPGFSDSGMTYLLPPSGSGRTRINNEDLLCAPSQRTAHQTDGYPRLRVSPGSYIAIKYLENGHVTLPENSPGKPPGRGRVHVFGTDNPDPHELLAKVLDWNADGTGGNKRGKLLTTQDFDDKRCYQVNGGSISIQRQKEHPNPVPQDPSSVNEQWCETNVKMPDDLSVGSTYTLYWVWQWPTSPGSPGLPDGKDEYYTTCSDVDVVSEENPNEPSNPLPGQDPQTAAVRNYEARANRAN